MNPRNQSDIVFEIDDVQEKEEWKTVLEAISHLEDGLTQMMELI